MYKITKTIDDSITICSVIDDAAKAGELFRDLEYDEFIRFKKLYESGISRENIERRTDFNIVYKKYTISVPTFSVTLTLTYIED